MLSDRSEIKIRKLDSSQPDTWTVFVVTLPSAYHCIFRLGLGTYGPRAFIHSLLGVFFYGVFFAKVLIVRTSGYPDLTLPRVGGSLFGLLMALWLTSAFWLFGVPGVGP